MKEKSIAELYSCMQADMKVALQTSRRAFDHNPTKGESTETDWIKWMRDYLPHRYCVDRAFVIDCENHVSDQIDLVIYDQQYSHPVFVMDGNKYITAESVYAIFEIKQTLDKTNIEYAGEKIKSVRQLNRTSTAIVSANGPANPKPLHRIISGILTLDSTWVEPINDNVVEYMMARPKDEQIDLICCIEKGSFAAIYEDSIIKDVLFSNKDESLIFFFLELLKKLQRIGTVPAIDISKYEKAITINSQNKS